MIARKRYEGLPVHVVFITDGSASHPGHPRLSPAAISTLRHQEAREALGILGVESGAIHFLNASDGTLNHLAPAVRHRLVDELTRLVATIHPREIFLPCCPDGSSEHDAAFFFICEALHRADVFPKVWQYPVWSWWNPVLLIERMIFNASHCRQPAEDFQFIKARALTHYRSQTHPLEPQVEPALPPELARIFRSDTEFFFRFDLLPSGPPLAPDTGRPVI